MGKRILSSDDGGEPTRLHSMNYLYPVSNPSLVYFGIHGMSDNGPIISASIQKYF